MDQNSNKRLFQVHRTGVTFTEVPNKMAFYIEMGGCLTGCRGCHSRHLWASSNSKDFIMPMESIVKRAKSSVDNCCNAIVIMGGDNNLLNTNEDLKALIKRLSEIAPVALYSSKLTLEDIRDWELTWIKLGQYEADLGGLDNPNTNQVFYEVSREFYRTTDIKTGVSFITPYNSFLNKTYLFQKSAPKGYDK